MPGLVSDSYDSEFGAGANAADVREAIQNEIERISKLIGPELKHIVNVVHGEEGKRYYLHLCEQDLRVIRFALNRALESI